jgi:hypothetical protein
MTNLYKSEASISTSAISENPSDFINPMVGMKKPDKMQRRRKKKKNDTKASDLSMMSQEIIREGDFVMGMTSEGMVHGMVEHIMTEGGTLGTPGTEYAIESMIPDNPAMSVRIYEEEDGKWEPTAYSIGMMYKDAEVIDINNHSMEDDEEDYDSEVEMAMFDAQMGKTDNSIVPTPTYQGNKQSPCWDGYVQRGMKPGEDGNMVPNCVPAEKADNLFEDDDTVEYDTDTVLKAEGYSPPAGARSAARRAIKFKEDGKAKGAGTMVGWTRAGQLARGETLSLSTVKRMFSYFSRHEVDKKGKDWGNTANPSNGYIMWLAWGGDAGFSWSRGIVNRERDKALFSDFGKDYSKPTQIDEIFKGIGVGSMVSWNSSGGRAEGKITRIIRNGAYKVPGTSVTVNGTEEDPAAVIRLYRDGNPTDTIVAHKIKTLRSK